VSARTFFGARVEGLQNPLETQAESIILGMTSAAPRSPAHGGVKSDAPGVAADPPGGAEADGRRSANAAMERYAAGDEDAFGELYDALAPRLYQFLLRQIREKARAEDLLQQTMLQIHTARGRFLRGADVMPWAFAIARRLLIDSVRRHKREVPLESGVERGYASPSQTTDDRLHDLRMADAAERELERLPESQRTAFVLIKKEGLSVREAAQVLGTTETAVKLRAHRAYVALRAVLGDTIEKE
jgi:RNA polymerase sigma-70 factor (ECF subfamily)